MQPGDTGPAVIGALVGAIGNSGTVAGYLTAATGSFATVSEPIALATSDIDGDGTVGVTDLTAIISAWGTGSGSADLNCDGIVDGADLGILLLHWGPVRRGVAAWVQGEVNFSRRPVLI